MTSRCLNLSEAFMAFQCLVLFASIIVCALAARGGKHEH